MNEHAHSKFFFVYAVLSQVCYTDIEILVLVLELFADYFDIDKAYNLWSPNPNIILNGLKSKETGFKWTKVDGSPLNFTGKFETTDVDYGYTAFSENQIHGKAMKIMLQK